MELTMKTKWVLSAAVVLVLASVGTVAAQSQNESLGDYARSVKKTKPSSSTQTGKVYDNDNLPADGTLSVVGNPSPADSADKKDDKKDQDGRSATADSKTAESDKSDTKSADKTDKKDEPQLKAGQPAPERDAALEAVKSRLDEQKRKVSMLQQELDLFQREHNLKIATFYQDPNHLADADSFYTDQAKYKEQLEEKQKALDAAKADLDKMQDEARRNGAPSSMLE